jgi:hypothetical protein
MTKENPEWINLSCQECVTQYPYLKKLVTPFAEDIIELICEHKPKEATRCRSLEKN